MIKGLRFHMVVYFLKIHLATFHSRLTWQHSNFSTLLLRLTSKLPEKSIMVPYFHPKKVSLSTVNITWKSVLSLILIIFMDWDRDSHLLLGKDPESGQSLIEIEDKLSIKELDYKLMDTIPFI